MAKAKKPGEGTNEETPDDDDDDAQFTPAQLRVMNNTVSSAVSAQLGRKLKPIQDQLGEVSSMRETIEGIAARLGGQQPAAGAQGVAGAGEGGGVRPKPQDDPEVLAMRKRIENMEKATLEKETAARNRDRDSRLTAAATSANVDKNRTRGAVALLRDQVKFDKDGNAYMTVQRNGLDEDVDLETGAAEFFKTDEGKAYLAPQQPVRGGSGSGGGGNGRTTSASVINRGQGGGQNAPVQQRNTAKVAAKQEAVNNLAGAVEELIGGGNINLG